MTDALLARLAYDPGRQAHREIAWPHSAPSPVRTDNGPNDALPRATAVVLTYTAAEKRALADVLTPGVAYDDWTRYTERFASYEPDLTHRSPAAEQRALGSYCLTTVGDVSVLCFGSNLHLATDSTALPFKRLVEQIIAETGCELFIDTGTAGGIGAQVAEGDAVVATNLRFDCTGQFRSEPWAHESFPTTVPLPADWTDAETLMRTFASDLAPARPANAPDPKVWTADVITCDAFLFDDAEDSYGLRTYDPAALAEEMDVAVLGLVARDLGASMPKYASVRSVSDPQMPDLGSIEKEKRDASQIYMRYGYAAQSSALCAVWQLLAAH